MYPSLKYVHLQFRMSKQNRIITANDNAPCPKPEMFVRLNNPAVKLSSEDSMYIAEPQNDAKISSNTSHRNRSLKLSVFLWLGSIVIGVGSLLTQTSTEVKSLSALAVLWVGLWTSYVAADYGRWRLSELAIVSALGGLMSAITIVAHYFGLTLTLIDTMILMSVLSLVIGYSLKSRMAILASICCTVLWAVMSIIGVMPFNNMAALFPVLTILQIHAGMRIKSALPIILSTLAGYLGLIGLLTSLWVENLIPASFAVSLVFIIGVAHHRVGKASEDSKIICSNIHIFSGWIIAVLSAMIFQSLWLSPNAVPSNESILSASGLNLWKIAVSLSILTIFISGIVRFKHSQITLLGIFLLTICSALIPLMMWMPSWPEAFAAAIPGISAKPAFGIIIGAAIIAAGLGFALNGIRRGSRFMLLLGLSTLGVEVFLLINPNLMSVDNVIVFSASFITALAIGGSIAGDSLAFQAPAPRLKPA